MSYILWLPAGMSVFLWIGPLMHRDLREPCGLAARWGLGLGTIAFFVGFALPIICTPDANQGPLLGVLVGPLTFVLASLVTFGISIAKGAEHRRKASRPTEES